MYKNENNDNNEKENKSPMVLPPIPESIANGLKLSQVNDKSSISGSNSNNSRNSKPVITTFNVSAPDDLKINQVVDAPKHSDSLWSKHADDDESFANKINEFAKLNDRSSRKLVDVINQDELLSIQRENEEKQWMDDVENVIKNEQRNESHTSGTAHTSAHTSHSHTSYTTKLKNGSGLPVASAGSGIPPPPPPMFSETGAEDGGLTSDDIHEWLKTRMNIYNQNHERRGTTLQQIRDAMTDQDARKEERERNISQSLQSVSRRSVRRQLITSCEEADALEEECVNLASKCEEYETQMTNLTSIEQELQRTKIILNRKTQDYDESQKQIESFENIIKYNRSDLKSAHAETQRVTKENSSLKLRNESLTKELNKYKNGDEIDYDFDIKVMEDQIVSLKQEKIIALDEANKMERECVQMDEKCSRLTLENKELKDMIYKLELEAAGNYVKPRQPSTFTLDNSRSVSNVHVNDFKHMSTSNNYKGQKRKTMTPLLTSKRQESSEKKISHISTINTSNNNNNNKNTGGSNSNDNGGGKDIASLRKKRASTGSSRQLVGLLRSNSKSNVNNNSGSSGSGGSGNKSVTKKQKPWRKRQLKELRKKEKKEKVLTVKDVKMDERQLRPFEAMDEKEYNEINNNSNIVEIEAEIDEYENSDDGWVSEESDNIEDANKISQSSTNTVDAQDAKVANVKNVNNNNNNNNNTSKKTNWKKKGKKEIKITSVKLPANMAVASNSYSSNTQSSNTNGPVVINRKGFNNLLAKFMELENNSSNKSSSSINNSNNQLKKISYNKYSAPTTPASPASPTLTETAPTTLTTTVTAPTTTATVDPLTKPPNKPPITINIANSNSNSKSNSNGNSNSKSVKKKQQNLETERKVETTKVERKTERKTQVVANVKRVKKRIFKPLSTGSMIVIESGIFPANIASRKPKFFACVDALPETTNIDTNEVDWKKLKKNDTLVPCLCFFVSEKTMEQLISNTSSLSVRSIKFQKEFAVYCTGILKLGDCIVESTERSVRSQLKEKGFTFDKPIAYDPSKNDLKTLYIGDERTGFIHKFLCDDAGERNEWLFSIQKLIRKRAESTMRRRNGSLNTINATVKDSNGVNVGGPVLSPTQDKLYHIRENIKWYVIVCLFVCLNCFVIVIVIVIYIYIYRIYFQFLETRNDSHGY